MSIYKINIQPDVSVLSVLRYLNYRPWYALGEFVDNSIQSFIKHREEIHRIHGEDFKLLVDINIDSASLSRISIRDNAAGIFESEYGRAFRPAAMPPDRSGLAEFGMGMKSAACWFAPCWTVQTSAIDESVQRTIRFDIDNIVSDDIKELEIEEVREAPEKHYTEIILENVFHVPVGRTVGKLKEHLTDIYRDFMRNGILELRFNGESLAYREPKTLKAAYFRDKNGPIKEWRKTIEFDFGQGLSVHGFAALLETASTAKAGFSLFRRGRVIQGSGDDGYRPAEIFGGPNSYRYQRLFGELHLSGFDVSHTKDGFRWDENEEPFLDLLRDRLDKEGLPLLEQAEGYRVRVAAPQLKNSASQAVDNTVQALKEHLPEVIPVVAEAELVDTSAEEMPHTSILAGKRFDIQFRDIEWTINIELTNDPTEEWLDVTDVAKFEQPRRLNIRVSMVHPFMIRFAQTDPEDVEALLRVAAAMSVAEVLAKDSGALKAGTMRRNFNEILRDALSEP